MLAKIAIVRNFLRGDGTVLRPCGLVNKPFIHEKAGIDYDLTSMLNAKRADVSILACMAVK
jgi:hypothetical protein